MSTQTAPAGRSHWLRGSHGAGPVTDLGRLLVGLIVIAIGVLFLLDSAGSLDADRAIDHWWPLTLVAAGGLTLAERPAAAGRGALLAGAGGVALLFTTGALHDDDWAYVWPVLVILAGAAILVRWSGRRVPAGALGTEVIRSTAVLGGTKLRSDSQSFRGAWLTAVFGGAVLDLRGARPAPEGATVNATAAFGGVDVLVPRGWRISIRSTPIFGGVDDKTDRLEPAADDAPTLHVDAVCLFGGVDIKHEK